jgi:HUS1 checkpoint protein
MRFRAKVTNVPLFYRVCQTLCKVDKQCTMHLTAKMVRFVVVPGITDGLELWAGMSATTLFDDMRIESMSANEITLHVQLDHLERALKTGQTAHEVVAKLTKRGALPYLSFVADVQMPQVMTISQDVPVEVLPGTHMAQLAEPVLPNPDVHIFLPKLKALRGVVDHLKNLADAMTISANMGGEFSLQVETANVLINTTYTGLEHPIIDSQQGGTAGDSGGAGHQQTATAASGNKQQSAKAKVDISKFARFLHCHQISPNSVICCIVQSRSLVLHAVLDDLYLTYYLPVLSI